LVRSSRVLEDLDEPLDGVRTNCHRNFARVVLHDGDGLHGLDLTVDHLDG